MLSPSASRGAWASLMMKTLWERLDSLFRQVLATFLFFWPGRKTTRGRLYFPPHDKQPGVTNVIKLDMFCASFGETCSERRLTEVIPWPKWPSGQQCQVSCIFSHHRRARFISLSTAFWPMVTKHSPLQNTWKASSADFTSTSIQPATYMLWFWSSLRCLDCGGLQGKTKQGSGRVLLRLLDFSHAEQSDSASSTRHRGKQRTATCCKIILDLFWGGGGFTGLLIVVNVQYNWMESFCCFS